MSLRTPLPVHTELSAQSSLEYIFLRYILARAALPEIADFTVPQFPVRIEGKFYTIDYGITGLKNKFAIELDGFVVHSQKNNFNKDRFRGNDLITDGWTLIRFSTENITGSPHRCVTQLQAALGRDPLLRNYLLDEIITELPAFSFQDWEAISQERSNIPNKRTAEARANRDSAFNRLRTEGPGFLINRRKAYIEQLKNPLKAAAFANSPAPAQQAAPRKAGVAPPMDYPARKKPPLKLIFGLAGLLAVVALLGIAAFLALNLGAPQPAVNPTGPNSAPAVVKQPTGGVSLSDEMAAQPCLAGQLKGSPDKSYYLPGQAGYAAAKTGVTCFHSAAEAEAAGYRKART
jgi:hypothetical protein